MTAAERVSPDSSMHLHPDIVALRERYEVAAEKPAAWTVEGMAVLAGGYAALSPWIVGFSGRASALAVNDLIIGLMVVGISIGLTANFSRMHGMAWVVPVMGVWLIVSPWIVQGITRTTGTVVSNVIVGAVVVLLGAAMMTMTRMAGGRPTHTA